MNNRKSHRIYKIKQSNDTRCFGKMRRIMFFILIFNLFFPVFSQSDPFPSRPVPPHLVNDFSAIFEPQQVRQLEKMLVDYNDSTSTQIAVITVNTLNGYDIADYTDRLAEKWGVGRKGKDNGIMILIKPKLSTSDYGEVRISIGYGLEDVIPDAITKRIIEQEMIPKFREGAYYEGVVSAVEVIMDLASGKYTADQYGDDDDNIVTVIIFIIVFILILRWIFPGRSGRGCMPLIIGGIGGFGRSGGGGKTGGFGGFGGGSFGGGGASGRW